MPYAIGCLLFYMLVSCVIKYWVIEAENENYKNFFRRLVQCGNEEKWRAAAPCMEANGLPQTVRLNSDWVLKWWPVWLKTPERNY